MISCDSEREILRHAGTIAHDAAVAKAEFEYSRFAEARAALPAPVDTHFEQAVQRLKKARRATTPNKNSGKERKKP